MNKEQLKSLAEYLHNIYCSCKQGTRAIIAKDGLVDDCPWYSMDEHCREMNRTYWLDRAKKLSEFIQDIHTKY